MSENLSMVVLMGKIGELLGVTRWQLKNSHGALAVGVYEFDDEQDEITPVVAMMQMDGNALTHEQEKELFELIGQAIKKDSKEEKFDAECTPVLCLKVGTNKQHLGSVVIATSLKTRSKSINEPMAISQIVRWINDSVESENQSRVLSVYGRFAGGETIHEASFTH